MNEKLEEYLFSIEPAWFRRDSPLESLMNYGFTCGDGWFFLVRNILMYAKAEHDRWILAKESFDKDGDSSWGKKLLEAYPTNPFAAPEFEVQQVKEKFSSLRFYYVGGTPEFRGFVTAMESISLFVNHDTGEISPRGSRVLDVILKEAHEKPD